ncbi:MAG: hypothetical protein MZU95_15845 [Desulfomicrobium escambiense]|nr:hypothetical protein [Desulfomicrobium escambiense]
MIDDYPEGKPQADTKQAVSLITAWVKQGADDQTVTKVLLAQGVPTERVPSLIAMTRPAAGHCRSRPGAVRAPARHCRSPGCEKDSLEKAAWLLRLVAIIQVVMIPFLLVVCANVDTDAIVAGKENPFSSFSVFSWFFGVTSAVGMFASEAIRAHKEWGRTAGIILGVMYLTNLKAGLLVGGILLYWLITGWEEKSAADPGPLKPHEKAAWLIRKIAWTQIVLNILLSFLLIVMVSIGMEESEEAAADAAELFGYFLGIIAVIGGWAGFQLVVGMALAERKEWSRNAGIVLGMLYLPALVIGTVPGGLILYWLTAGWKEK